MNLQSETKAIGQELIYEAKLQNSAWPGRPQTSNHPLGSCPPTKARLGLSKNVLKALVAQSYSTSKFLLYLYIEENATKNFEVLQL